MSDHQISSSNKLRLCLRCGFPETSENIDFDDMEICKACRSSEQKMHINWKLREQRLREILDRFRQKVPFGYDCMIPISGGKDSAFQLYLLTKVYDMKPLAVTFSHNWYSKAGRYNLRNILDRTGVDHIEFTPHRDLVNQLARESLFQIGDACWHCHMGVESFPMHMAVALRIPLLIYGESVAEHSGKATYLDNPDFSVDYFLQYSAKVQADEMIAAGVAKKDLQFFESPSVDAIKEAGIVRIHLGDFIFWDAERQTEFVRDYLGWREDLVEGTFKRYKSVECIMPGVHDYAKFLKRGFGRGTDFAVQDVRSGILTREQGFELHKKHDPVRPKILDYYLDISGLTEAEFENILVGKRTAVAKEKLGSPKEIQINHDYPINESVSEAIANIGKHAEEKRQLQALQTERIFPSYGNSEKRIEILKKKYSTKNIIEYGLIKDPHCLSATQALHEIKNGRLSAYELAKATLAQVERLEPDVKAWVCIDPEYALLQAAMIDEMLAKNVAMGSLAGVSVGVKDVFNTADFPTHMGSQFWQNFHAGNDARVVFQVRLNGGVIPGKTVTAEFSIHEPGPTRNPYDLDRNPGTSSSGSAVAVACRMAPVALSTQTAGSTIRPASYCGIYGMKPSFGIIPRTGVLKTTDVLDHVSYMGLSIADLRLMLDTLRVRGDNYPYIQRFLENDEYTKPQNQPLKIGFCKTPVWNEAAHYTQELVTGFAHTLEKSGLIVDEIELPELFQEGHEIHSTLYDKYVSYYFMEEYKSGLMSDTVKAMVEQGQQTSLDEFRSMLSKQASLENELDSILSDYDVLLSYSTAEIAPKGGVMSEKKDPTLLWTLARVPTINIPIGKGPLGLPLGVQVLSRRYRDLFLLDFCKDLQLSGLIPEIAPMPDWAKTIT